MEHFYSPIFATGTDLSDYANVSSTTYCVNITWATAQSIWHVHFIYPDLYMYKKGVDQHFSAIIANHIMLQAELDHLLKQCKRWQLNFNISKCKLIHYGKHQGFGEY